MPKLCPCGSKKTLAACCQPFIDGKKLPAKPEALLRSRYTAYVLGYIDYIYDSMRGPARKGFSKRVAGHWASQVEWLRLEVGAMEHETQDCAHLAFKAYYRFNDQEVCLQETSIFSQKKGRWFYTDSLNDSEQLIQEKE